MPNRLTVLISSAVFLLNIFSVW